MPPPQVQHGNLEMLANMIGNRPPPTPSTSHLETSNCNLNFNLDHLAIAGSAFTSSEIATCSNVCVLVFVLHEVTINFR